MPHFEGDQAPILALFLALILVTVAIQADLVSPISVPALSDFGERLIAQLFGVALGVCYQLDDALADVFPDCQTRTIVAERVRMHVVECNRVIVVSAALNEHRQEVEVMEPVS